MTTEMPTEATEETAPDPHADAKCDNCSAAVKRRRPSLTGKHFCMKKECQRAKHRFYNRRRADGSAESEAKLAETHRRMLANFVGDVANADRVDCDTCGRRSVIPRYGHPTPDWTAPCYPEDRLPASGDPALSTALMRSVYPA